MGLSDVCLTLCLFILRVDFVICDGNCSHTFPVIGEIVLQNVTETLLNEYSTCFYEAESFRFVTTYNISLKELLGYLPINQSDVITELYIGKSNIPEVLKDEFGKLTNIETIFIRNSGVKTLVTGAFTGLAKLTQLTLDHNEIRTLTANTFSRLPSLKSINLSFNHLKEIGSLVFNGLPKLQSLFLYNNRLKHIANDAFVNVARKANMFKIHIQNNQLERLPYELLSKIPVKKNFEIKAKNNNLTEISDDIKNIKALEILHVGSNKLKHVSKYLASLSQIRYINLNNNNLQTLPEEIFLVLNRSDSAMDGINLTGNPWKCDCHLKWLITFIQSHNVTQNIECQGPKYIEMIHFRTDDLQCDSSITKDTLSSEVISAIVGVCVLGVCCVTTTLICLWKTRVNKRMKSAKMVTNQHYYQSKSVGESSAISVTPLIDNPIYKEGENLKLQIGFSEKALYGTLRLGGLLGRGTFGDVYEGFASGFCNTWEKVAVKKLKENSTQIETDSLMKEYQNLIEVGKHQNIIQVHGTGLVNGSRIMVMELAENGDLLTYIRKLEANYRKMIQNLDRSEEKYYLLGQHPRLFSYMWQVAKGMDYLTQMKIVHRDLAARNILLTKDTIAKISDFGLSRDVYETGYYFQESNGRLPYKWMSPETLACGKYTTRSDVWSYGVLLWEVVTLGSSPYPGIPPNMLINMYKSGYIMPQPPLCPDNVYTIMSRCWQHVPEHRPNFKTLVTEFDDIVQNGSKESLLDDSAVISEGNDV